MQADDAMQPVGIDPLPYQVAVVDFLQREEAELWEWFSSHKVRAEYTDAVRLDLLKSTYRLEREGHDALYGLADRAAKRLGLDVPITFYQAQNHTQMNAGVAFVPGEAHVTFSGSVLQALTEDELFAVVGHELAHVSLWEGWENQYLIADQVLSAMSVDREAAEVHLATGRFYGLFMEVFCDRNALAVVGDVSATISMLVKIETGLEAVSAESYVRQAEEIFAKESAGTEQMTHPESYIRARAIDLWERGEAGADGAIERMIRGPLGLNNLDLIGQQDVAGLTRSVVDELISPKWFQTDAVLAHARMLFETYDGPGVKGREGSGLAEVVRDCDPQLRDYFCYLILDFVSADRDLEDAPRAAGLLFSDRYGFGDRFGEVMSKELGLRKKQLEVLRQDAESIVARAGQTAGDA